ncbi:c-type cytochrome domain-containing protein [Emticicia agri]|uniref:Ribonuclease inhibitor n=1 Tax=Emticicia agri TaxID=2492393 RepID=A0A4Q5M4J9_9BACT|nr:c-type cytochrome domain-containing protein [Emticicia agri]RYU97262.1 ribonuclease inhibitor [Emticicia agri]
MSILAISEWTSFFGRFHPILVHLPIGFLIVVGVFELLKIIGRLTISQETIRVLLFISAISATFACVAGYFLSLEGGYNDEMLEEHKIQGIWLAVFCWVAWLAKNTYLNERIGVNKILYAPALILSLILMMVAGHHGGNLTHGETYLTDNTPQPFRAWLGMPEKTEKESESLTDKPKIQNINEAMVYQDIIRPIFKQKCESCHNANKMKGELRMDEIDLLKKGGKHGAIFEANNVEGSEFIKRILLPESDDDHMPPKGKIQITENELALMKWWIEQGVPFDKKVSQVTVTDAIKPVLASLGVGDSVNTQQTKGVQQDKFVIEEKILSGSTSPINDNILVELKKSGALILPFAQNNNFVEISYINNSKLTDDQITGISKVQDQTLWLRLSDTQITDKGLAEVVKLTNLTRLHLEQTKITDQGLNQLGKLTNLEYLNLIGTKVSDAGIKQLASLKNLKKLYLWKTEVTPKGVEALKKNLPDLKVDLGMTEQQIAEFLKAKPNEVSDDVYKKK